MSDLNDHENYTNNTAIYNYTEFCEYEQSIYFQTIIYLMYAVIFVVATLGNGVVCYIVISSPRMRTVTNYFITNLAVGDLLITVFCVPFTSISYLKQYWEFGSFLCPVVNYFQAVAVFVSSYTLVAISIDRYMAIMWPLRPRLTKRLASIIILIVWMISMITVIPILIFSRLTQPSAAFVECDKYICREDWSSVGTTYEAMYTKALAVFQFIIPLSVFVFTYTSIAVVIWCHRIPGEAENYRDQRIAKSKRKVVVSEHESDSVEINTRSQSLEELDDSSFSSINPILLPKKKTKVGSIAKQNELIQSKECSQKKPSMTFYLKQSWAR